MGCRPLPRPSGPSWKNSPTSTPAATSWSRAASMSATTRTGSGGRNVLAEMDRAGGARRRELDQAEIFAGGAVNVEPPSDPLVKRLRAIDIRNGDDDDLELHVNSRDPRVSCCVVIMDFIGAHQYLPCSVGDRRHDSIHEGMRRRSTSNDLNFRWAAFRA